MESKRTIYIFQQHFVLHWLGDELPAGSIAHQFAGQPVKLHRWAINKRGKQLRVYEYLWDESNPFQRGTLFDRLEWKPCRDREPKDTTAKVYRSSGKQCTYCPAGRAWRGKSWCGVQLDFMGAKQAKQFVETSDCIPSSDPITQSINESRDVIDEMLDDLLHLGKPTRSQSLTALGINTDTPEAVTGAYRKLAAKHHPDHGGDAQEFHRIRVAYERLVAS
jgi:hypothetical protein